MVRSALIAAIYKKELKLSSLARQSHPAGEVVSYMSVGAYRVGDFLFYMHLAWVVPLQIIIAMGILFYCVGWATLAGIGILCLTMLLNGPVVKMHRKVQARLLDAQDDRLRATSEALKNMKIIKLQAWEDKFLAGIQAHRSSEMQSLKGVQLRKTFNSIFFWVSPILVTTSTIVTSYFLGVTLTASNIFTALATLRIIQEPIRTVPDMIAQYVNVRVSLERIGRYLCAEELDPTIVDRTQADFAVRIDDGYFDWGSEGVSPTLRDVNVVVKHGQKVAVCGEVGSGKSTLLEAMPGEVPKIRGTSRRYSQYQRS